MSTITQRQSIAYTGTFPLLRYYLTQLSGDVEEYDVGEKQALRVFKAVNVVFEGRMVTLEVANFFGYNIYAYVEMYPVWPRHWKNREYVGDRDGAIHMDTHTHRQLKTFTSPLRSGR